jgi:hypothetical protein
LFVFSLNGGAIVVKIACASFSTKSPFDVLLDHGIDLLKKVTSFTSSTFIILDDCHAWFGYDDFWDAILKVISEWCPTFVRFLFIATTLLNKSKPSPLYFNSLPRLVREDFILSRDESFKLAEILGASRIGAHFCNVLVEECAGIVGLISLSMGFLSIDFRNAVDCDEGDYLRHFYSLNFTPYLARCFSFDVTKPNLSTPAIKALSAMFVTSEMMHIEDPEVLGNEGFAKLEDSGIILKLKGLFVFSSPCLQAFYRDPLFLNATIFPRKLFFSNSLFLVLRQKHLRMFALSRIRSTLSQ